MKIPDRKFRKMSTLENLHYGKDNPETFFPDSPENAVNLLFDGCLAT